MARLFASRGAVPGGKERRWTGLVVILSSGLLFASFYANAFGILDPARFTTSTILDAELVGRMVKSRHDGNLSSGGLLGLGGPETEPPVYSRATLDFQTTAYTEGLAFESFVPYRSQVGGQGLLFSTLDRLVEVEPETKLSLFRAATSALTAVTLSAIVLWFSWEFGLLVGIAAFVSVFLSQWLIVFSRSLFWSTWAFYLPMVTVCMYLHREGGTHHRGRLLQLIFASVLIKCLFNGYEFITTALIMMTVPMVYYGVRQGEEPSRIVMDLARAAGASVGAVLVSFGILIAQIGSAGPAVLPGTPAVDGSLKSGIEYIVFSAAKRSWGGVEIVDPDFVEGIEAPLTGVLATYLKGTYLDLNNFFSTSSPFVSRIILDIRYLYLIPLIGVASFILWRARQPTQWERRSRALLVACWFSVLAPLSWLVLFKSHAYIHTHLDFIVWQMPFTMFGAAVIMAALTCGLRPAPSAVELARTDT